MRYYRLSHMAVAVCRTAVILLLSLAVAVVLVAAHRTR